MLKHAPTIYIPLQPADDGIALPTLLSIVVHGAILAFIVYSHQVPKIELPPAIETSIVTPEELVAIQSEVKANRAAQGAAADTLVDKDTWVDASATSTPPTANPDAVRSSATAANSEPTSFSDSIRRRVPVIFSRSSQQADDFTPPTQSAPTNDTAARYVDPEITARLNQHREDSNKRREAFNREQKRLAASKIDSYSEQVDQNYSEELAALEQFKEIEKHPSKTERPKRVDVTLPSSISHAEANQTQQGPATTLHLGDAKSASASGAASGSSQGEAKSSVSKPSSAGAKADNASSANNTSNANNVSSALVAHIRPYWSPPTGRVGKLVKATIKVDANGNVLSVSANSNDAALNQSLEQAVRSASPITPVVGTKLRTITANFVVAK